MKNYWLIMIVVLSLAGCDLLGTRQDLVRQNVLEADKLAQKKLAEYKAEIRPVREYKPYHYENKIEDPFRIRGFLLTEEVEEVNVSESASAPVCEPPSCVPPEMHTKTFLENYSLDDLAFVGTLNRDGNIGLIKTPDLGVFSVKTGDYIGRKNGKVLVIKETAIVLQEKIYKGGLWEDKKTVLMINK